MFGIKTKKNNIIALISGIIGVVILALKVFKVLEDKDTITLLALIFLLLGFALYLRPKMKLMKAQVAALQEYREKLFTEMTNGYKKKIDIDSIEFTEDENGVMHYKNISFESLNYEEFLYVVKELLKEFILIVYGQEEKGKKGYTITIPTFVVKVKKYNGDILESKILDNYKLIK